MMFSHKMQSKCSSNNKIRYSLSSDNGLTSDIDALWYHLVRPLKTLRMLGTAAALCKRDSTSFSTFTYTQRNFKIALVLYQFLQEPQMNLHTNY